MRLLIAIVAALGTNIACAQGRYSLRLIVRTNRPCLITVDGRWKTECNDVCVFTWNDYPDKVKRGTITAVQSGDDQPISRDYVVVVGDKSGEINLNFSPRLFRGAREYPPVVDHPSRPLNVPTITELSHEALCPPPGHPNHPGQPSQPVVPSSPTIIAPTTVEANVYWFHWEVYFWIGAFLLLVTLLVYSYWKWKVCKLWKKELECKAPLQSSGHANIVGGCGHKN